MNVPHTNAENGINDMRMSGVREYKTGSVMIYDRQRKVLVL